MLVVIPVHGLVQLGSNASRAVMRLKYIDYELHVYFTVGGVLGAIIVAQFVMIVPLDYMKVFIAIFVNYLI